MLGRDFAFRGYPRRVARAVVDAMVPRWPDFPVDITDDVLAQVEEMVRHYPPLIQVGLLASLVGLEFGSPFFGPGIKPLSWTERQVALERLEAIGDHRLPQVRMLVMAMKILVSFSAYSRPDVEAFLGYRRREWRQARQALRRILLAADPAELPPTPSPLADGRVVSPAEYLRFHAHQVRTAPAQEAG